jgi:hypothetical protein
MYLAAAYNGGEARAIRSYRDYLRRCRTDPDGTQWCKTPRFLADETENYLDKFFATWELLRQAYSLADAKPLLVGGS